MSSYDLQQEMDFKYLETGEDGEVILLLHGLFGALSNFEALIDHFGETYNVVFPILPIYTMPIRKVSVSGLVKHVDSFVDHKGYDRVHLVGNSLGGHIGLLYALKRPEKVQSITLTGSSGLFESALGNTFPKRSNYEYVKRKTKETFYDPDVASDEMIDDIFEIVNNRNKAIRIVAVAKTAVRHNLEDKLDEIKAPTLLIWGKQDHITPPFVGEKFHELIEDSQLEFIDKCGHAPMMEHPQRFNELVEDFLEQSVLA